MLEECEQHFAFKLADGYSEEEIAARLGSPAELAAQFEAAPQPKRRGSVALTWLWLAWADLAYGIFAVLLIAWGAVMAACVLSFGLTAVCLIGRLDRFPPATLPPMPYVSALLLGLALAALTVACCIGCVWIFSAYVQSCRNKLAAARGESKRSQAPRVRTALLVSLAGFGVCLMLGMAVSAKLAGRLDFWNDWNWFYIHNCRTYDIPIQ